MGDLSEDARRRREMAHAPFLPGMRVRLKENFPYSCYWGKLGTITRLPWQLQACYIHVCFDGSAQDVKYAKVYLEPVDTSCDT